MQTSASCPKMPTAAVAAGARIFSDVRAVTQWIRTRLPMESIDRVSTVHPIRPSVYPIALLSRHRHIFALHFRDWLEEQMTIASRSAAAARAVAAPHATHVSILLALLLLSFSPSAAFASKNSLPIKRVVVVGGVSVSNSYGLMPACDTFVLTADADILSLYPSSPTPRRMGMSTRAFGASRLLITRRRQNILRWKYQLSLATPRHIGLTSDSSTLI